MPSRLLSSILFLGILAIGVSSGQEGIAEVPIPRNVYGGILACGPDGQAYFHSLGSEYFVLRASLDGSSAVFRSPDKDYADAVAPLRSWREYPVANASAREEENHLPLR